MSTTTFPTNQIEIFARSLDQRRDQLSGDVAKFFLTLELSDADRIRLDELASKAQQGTLSPEEEGEIDEYRRIGRLVEIMKLKAEAALRGISGAPKHDG
jgi:hypothetical protein